MAESLQKILHTFSALADLGQEIADTGDFHEMMQTSLQLLLGSLAIMRGSVAEYRSDGSALSIVANRLMEFEPEASVAVGDSWIDPLRERGLSVIRRNAGEGQEFSGIAAGLSWMNTETIHAIVPLVAGGRFIGLIMLGAKASGEEFTDEDCTLISTIARQIAVGMRQCRMIEELERRAEENHRLYDGLRTIYQETVRAFAAAIDCKDKYTQGHSERVGKYSEIIARQLGWTEEEIEGAAVAGYLHDVGKLAVERDIINAPYRINAKESSELNKHPAVGYEILAAIRHPYADIPQAAHYHHERLDGGGYPEGLTGDQIPIGVKIVTLADSFDAMTTDRPYRRRRSFVEVIEDIRRNTGTQFSGKVVAAFCRSILAEFDGKTTERRFLRLLG
ncbi:MAG: HD domain-containing phosphohydrolase, partial [Pyrinomonadaceae bacterium]